ERRLEVRQVDHVEVDDPERPHASRGQVHGDPRPEAAGPDAQNPGLQQLSLPGGPDLRQDDVPRVPEDLLLGEPAEPGHLGVLTSCSWTTPSRMVNPRITGLSGSVSDASR